MNYSQRPASRRQLSLMFTSASFILLLIALLVGQSQQALAQWSTTGSDLYNTPGGNVGVGTTSPTTGRVHISGTNTSSGGFPLIKLENRQVDANSNIIGHTYWLYAGANGIAGDFGIYNFTTGYYGFYLTGSGNVGMGLVSGKVGIGTTTPGAKLEVVGGASADQLRIGDGTSLYKIGRNTGDGVLEFVGTQASYTGYRFKAEGGLDVLTIPRLDRNAYGNSTEIIFGRGNGTASLLGGTLRAPDGGGIDVNGGSLTVSAGFATGTAVAGDILFQGSTTGSSSSNSLQAAATRMVIKGGSGNVGIGTTTPGYKLEVNGAINAADIYKGGQPLNSSQWANSGSNISFSSGKVGIGGAAPTDSKTLKVTGDMEVTGVIYANYQDMAEWVPSSKAIPAATVVVLDVTKSNQVLPSTQAYDTRVAGVISTQPGIALGERGEGKVLVATTGRVKVKVDATRAPVHVGDLLVTSDVEGVAMKSEPLMIQGRPFHSPGTLIGKALEPLEKGTGEILVLLSLQ